MFVPELHSFRFGIVTDVINQGQNLSVICFEINPKSPQESPRVHFGRQIDQADLSSILDGYVTIERVVAGLDEERTIQQRLSNPTVDIVTEPTPYDTFRSLIIQGRKAS